ncbi:MAG: erythromycin esterase family protein [Pseudomonadota bacterium]|jgi:erythromycin esterase-like protein
MSDTRPVAEEGRILPRGPAGAIAAAAEPLPDIDDPAFGRLFDRFGDARVVLLGESTHGTSEFYRARAAITRWLVENRGFNIVALEADWPDARVLDAHVRGARRPPGAAFDRFPRWMWRNREFDAFLGWMAGHNRGRPRGAQARICGLDLYNLAASMRTVVDYLDRVDPEAAAVARERYGCLSPWATDPAAYGRMAVSGRYAACEGAVAAMLVDMLRRQLREDGGRDDALLDATQSARLVRSSEAYYRAMYYGGGEAWNLRDTHMFETLEALLAAQPDAKAVVWAHNSHVGDARATEMGAVRDQLNLGQLCREAWGEAARLIGFGTHTGTVACASDWDAPMEVKEVRPSLPESHERQSHNAGLGRFLLDLRPGANSATRRALADPRLERLIGVLYRPETERWSHYVECRLPDQFDAWVWFDETTAVTPLDGATTGAGEDETWPFGL